MQTTVSIIEDEIISTELSIMTRPPIDGQCPKCGARDIDILPFNRAEYSHHCKCGWGELRPRKEKIPLTLKIVKPERKPIAQPKMITLKCEWCGNLFQRRESGTRAVCAACQNRSSQRAYKAKYKQGKLAEVKALKDYQCSVCNESIVIGERHFVEANQKRRICRECKESPSE